LQDHDSEPYSVFRRDQAKQPKVMDLLSYTFSPPILFFLWSGA